MRNFIIYDGDPNDPDLFHCRNGTQKPIEAFNEAIAAQIVAEQEPELGEFILAELSYIRYNTKDV
jgi:hypothetical protein